MNILEKQLSISKAHNKAIGVPALCWLLRLSNKGTRNCLNSDQRHNANIYIIQSVIGSHKREKSKQQASYL